MALINTPETEHSVISIQGLKGSFHHIAAEQLFGKANFLERGSFERVFEDCATDRADFAVVAIENSIVGSLLENYDLLAQNHLEIVGEALLHIQHHLIAHPDTQLKQIQEIWSHPMAINQSKAYLDNLNKVVIEKPDTAASVQMIKDHKLKHVAAIASDRAAELFDMEIIKRNIETDPHNYTRFLILSNGKTFETREDLPRKMTLHFSVPEGPGALVRFLQPLAEAEINMSMIESRPRIGKPWKYDFFVDLQLQAGQETPTELLEDLEEQTLFLNRLGCYPCFGYLREVSQNSVSDD